LTADLEWHELDGIGIGPALEPDPERLFIGRAGNSPGWAWAWAWALAAETTCAVRASAIDRPPIFIKRCERSAVLCEAVGIVGHLLLVAGSTDASHIIVSACEINQDGPLLTAE
jgi:hypothetical protein